MSKNTENMAGLWKLVQESRIVDLSITTSPDMYCSPIEGQRMSQWVHNTYDEPRGLFKSHVQVHDDHTGTHIDAPSHMIPPAESGLPHANSFGSITVEQIEIRQMIGPAVVVDVRDLIESAPRGEKTHLAESPWITREYLENWERKFGQFQADEVVLFRTDWSDRYYVPLPEGYGYDRSNPDPTPEAIEFLFDRGVRHLGIDARSIGAMQDDYNPHWAALGRGMVVTENLTRLGELPVRGALFVFLPHKFKGATGGLGRAIGVIPA